MLDGENVYAATHRYEYSPVWSYIVALIWAGAWIARLLRFVLEMSR